MIKRGNEYLGLGEMIILKCILGKWFRITMFWNVLSYSLIEGY
jgi:hypothetical protein